MILLPYLDLQSVRELDYEWNLEEPELSRHLDNGGRQPRTRPSGRLTREIDSDLAQYTVELVPNVWFPTAGEFDCFFVLDEEHEDYLLAWCKHNCPHGRHMVEFMRRIRMTLDQEDMMWRVFK